MVLLQPEDLVNTTKQPKKDKDDKSHERLT